MAATVGDMAGSSPSNSSVLPAHPFSPVDASIPGYAANTLTTPTILAIFAGTVAAVLVPTYHRISRARPDLGRGEVATALWFVLCALIHTVLEGYFALHYHDIGSRSAVLAQMWKEYSLSDSRYLTRDAFTVCMETVTAALWGPLSAVVAWCIVRGHPLRHPLQLVVSLGQLYGDVLYYATFTFQHRAWGIHHCRPEQYYFYFYYVGLNAFWIVIPSLLVFSSVRASARAFAAVQKAGGVGKGSS